MYSSPLFTIATTPTHSFPGFSTPPHIPLSSPRTLRVDFPYFDGLELVDWIYRAERYFVYHQTPNNYKIQLALIHMEGATLPCFQWQHKGRSVCSWEEFTRQLETTFGLLEYDNPQEAISKQPSTEDQDRRENFIQSCFCISFPFPCFEWS